MSALEGTAIPTGGDHDHHVRHTHQRPEEVVSVRSEPVHDAPRELEALRKAHIDHLYKDLLRAKPEGAGLAPSSERHVHAVLHAALEDHPTLVR